MLIALWLWTLIFGGVLDRDVVGGRGGSTMETAVGQAQVMEDGTPIPPPKP